jgi:ferrochelatase
MKNLEHLGGEDVQLVASLNDDPKFIEALVAMLKN